MDDFNFNLDNLQTSVQRFFEAEPDDIASDEAAMLLAKLDPAQFRENPLTLSDLKTVSPKLWKYFQNCSDCMNEFELFLSIFNQPETDAAQLTIPRRPDQQTLVQRVGELIERLIQFPGFPTLELSPTRGAQMNLDQVEIDLNLDYILEIDPAIDANDPSKRDVFLTLSGQDDESEVEGTTVEILLAGSNREIKSTTFDEMGDATVSGLEPDVAYDLRIRFAEEIVRVREIKLPSA